MDFPRFTNKEPPSAPSTSASTQPPTKQPIKKTYGLTRESHLLRIRLSSLPTPKGQGTLMYTMYIIWMGRKGGSDKE